MSSTKSSPRDFSLFSLFTAGLACLVPLASAYTQPVGSEPKGNPISQPGLNSVVPAGEAFAVTWEPTTSGTVTLVLLKGPSTNAVPQYAIAQKIKNDGIYSWTPSTDLAPGQTGYGIQLIDDENGQYQYTTQFGISNPDYKSQSSSSSSWPSTSSTWTSTSSASTTATMSSTAAADATVLMTGGMFTTTKALNSSATALPVTGTGSIVASTGGLPGNGSMVHPTGSMSVPSSLATYASASGVGSATGSSSAPIQTGAAAAMATSFVGLVVAAGVAVFAF